MDSNHRVLFGLWCNVHQNLADLQNLYKQAFKSSREYFTSCARFFFTENSKVNRNK